MFELKLEKLCDYTITITSEEKLQMTRLKKRSSQNYQLMLFLKKQQFNQQKKMQLADFVIENDVDIQITKKSLQTLVDKLNKIRYNK